MGKEQNTKTEFRRKSRAKCKKKYTLKSQVESNKNDKRFVRLIEKDHLNWSINVFPNFVIEEWTSLGVKPRREGLSF